MTRRQRLAMRRRRMRKQQQQQQQQALLANYDYGDYGGLSGLGTSAIGATATALGGAAAGTGLIDRHGSHGVHSHGGGGDSGYLYVDDPCGNGLNPILFLSVLGLLGAATFFIATYLTMNGRRRSFGPRSGGESDPDGEDIFDFVDEMTDLALSSRFSFQSETHCCQEASTDRDRLSPR